MVRSRTITPTSSLARISMTLRLSAQQRILLKPTERRVRLKLCSQASSSSTSRMGLTGESCLSIGEILLEFQAGAGPGLSVLSLPGLRGCVIRLFL